MKKVLLTGFSLIIAGLCSAQIKIEPSKVIVNSTPELVKPFTTPFDIAPTQNQQQSQQNPFANSQNRHVDRRIGSISYVRIGNTRYDLQTNSSIGRRIILHPNGTITATFTTATDNNFTSRGTGYNHYNGTNWMNVSFPTPRIESTRTGWPAIGIYDGNKEYILGHVAELGGFVMSKNQGIGQTSFTESTVLMESNALPIWGRTASNNQNIIHVISGYTSTDDIPAPVKKGVTAPLNYSRSRDAGVTWDLFGEITDPGLNFIPGKYKDIKVISLGSGVTADFTVTGDSISSFNITNYGSGLQPNYTVTLFSEVTGFTPTLDSLNNILNLGGNYTFQLIEGSSVSSQTPGFLDPNTIISSIINDSTVALSVAPLRNGIDTLTFTPPYGDGAFFQYKVGDGHILLPGYDSTRYLFGSADNYSIDCRDSIVAIVSGRLGHDLVLWKSTDNGENFTKTFVDSFPFDPTTFSERITDDTAFCSDGTSDVIIDKDGNVHVFYALTQAITNPNNNEGFFFVPGMIALVYWNDVIDSQILVTNATPFDRNLNGIIDISTANTAAVDGGRLGSTALLRMPSCGMDNNGNLFVVFTVPVEGATDFGSGMQYRDVFIMHSTDGGMSWEGPQNLTQTFNFEEDFASMAKVVNDFVHIIYQRDILIGTNLQNNQSGNHDIPIDGNDIYYAAVPVSEILAGTIGNTWGLNVDDQTAVSKLFVVSQNYPNPFTGETSVNIYLNQFVSNININIIDMTGKQVYNQNFKDFTPGNHEITIDGSNLKSGIYFYTISNGKTSETRKMMVY